MEPSKREKAEALEEAKVQREIEGCTFAPAVSQNAHAYKSSSRHMGTTKSFLSRVRERNEIEKREKVAKRTSRTPKKSAKSSAGKKEPAAIDVSMPTRQDGEQVSGGGCERISGILEDKARLI